MNLVHLKYAVEVDKTRTISQAAENLFMSQPNLSRGIKELEESLGIKIFKRTTKGMIPTPQGEEFLHYAKKILSQVDEVEMMYKEGKNDKQKFSISVPRATYISCAFTEFAKHIDVEKPAEIFYRETNAMRAIDNILQADYKLGIIRYQTIFEQYFATMLHERALASEPMFEFSYCAIMSKEHPLAKKPKVMLEDFKDYIEICHGDPYVPSLPFQEVRKAELSKYVNKHVYVFERGSQFDMLSNVPTMFMWGSPMSARLLDQFGLVQRQCEENKKVYRDILVYREGYKLTEYDKAFIEAIESSKAELQKPI